MQTGRLTQPPQDDITPQLGMRILCNAANEGEGGLVHTLYIVHSIAIKDVYKMSSLAML